MIKSISLVKLLELHQAGVGEHYIWYVQNGRALLIGEKSGKIFGAQSNVVEKLLEQLEPKRDKGLKEIRRNE